VIDTGRLSCFTLPTDTDDVALRGRAFARQAAFRPNMASASTRRSGCIRSDAEIATMRRLNAALDPRNILNPGRVFDLDPTAFCR
jgi:FAD/FMN-containing dehydrogenase